MPERRAARPASSSLGADNNARRSLPNSLSFTPVRGSAAIRSVSPSTRGVRLPSSPPPTLYWATATDARRPEARVRGCRLGAAPDAHSSLSRTLERATPVISTSAHFPARTRDG